jgi:hypothetical protein
LSWVYVVAILGGDLLMLVYVVAILGGDLPTPSLSWLIRHVCVITLEFALNSELIPLCDI